jgi:hypothetical protein
MLNVAGRFPPLKALPVQLLNKAMPIGMMTLKGRTLTPMMQMFIDNVRAVAKSLVKS